MKPSQLHLPLCCTLIGGLVAICWAMVYLQSELDRTRVSLDQSVPLLVGGIVSGFCVGWLLKWLCGKLPQLGFVCGFMLPPILAGCIAAPFGWLARNHHEDWSGAEAITHTAVWGFGGVFVLCGLRQVVSALRRRSNNSPS